MHEEPSVPSARVFLSFFQKLICLLLWSCLQDLCVHITSAITSCPIQQFLASSCTCELVSDSSSKYAALTILIDSILLGHISHKKITIATMLISSSIKSNCCRYQAMFKVHQKSKTSSSSIDMSVFVQRCVSAHADAVWAQAGCDFISMSLFNFLAVGSGFENNFLACRQALQSCRYIKRTKSTRLCCHAVYGYAWWRHEG